MLPEAEIGSALVLCGKGDADKQPERLLSATLLVLRIHRNARHGEYSKTQDR
jgi:hypothetical protein